MSATAAITELATDKEKKYIEKAEESIRSLEIKKALSANTQIPQPERQDVQKLFEDQAAANDKLLANIVRTHDTLEKLDDESRRGINLSVSQQLELDILRGKYYGLSEAEITSIRTKAKEVDTTLQATKAERAYANALAGTKDRINDLQYQIAHADEGSADRIREAYLQTILDIQTADEKATIKLIQNQVKIEYQFDVSKEHLNDGVVEFLANTKSLQQTLQDVRTNAAKSIFSVMDAQIDKLMNKMPKALGFLKEFAGTALKDFAHLAEAQLFEKLFGLKSPQSANKQLSSATVTNTSATNANTLAINSLTVALREHAYAVGASSASDGTANLTANELTSGAANNSTNTGGALHEAGQIMKAGEQVGSVAKDVINTANKAKDIGDIAGKAAGIFNKIPGLGKIGGFLDKIGLGGGGAGSAAMFSNPFTAALAIAPIALPFVMKLFGGGIEKDIRNAVKNTYKVDIKDNKVIEQIKQIGDQTFGKELKSHIPQLVAMDQVKQIVTKYGTFDDPNFFNTPLGKTAHLTDMSAAANQFQTHSDAFVHRASGGPFSANQLMLVGEQGPELVRFNQPGVVHTNSSVADMTRNALSKARSTFAQSNQNESSQTNQQSSSQGTVSQLHVMVGAMSEAIQGLMGQVARLTAVSPGHVLQMGAQQNPGAISGGLLDGLRSNFDHRRELNLLTGS